jgi:hypothetical protein
MSTLKADAVTSAQDNTALTLSGTGTGGVKVNDFFVQTKGADIASDTALTLGKDGNQFDVTGTTTITSIATQGIGSYVTLHFDGILTFTHHSTNLILPGAANITTAAGDIAVMYEYASADWRCVSYTKASGAAVVAGAGMEFVEAISASTSSTITFTHTIASGYDYIVNCRYVDNSADLAIANGPKVQLATSGPSFSTSGYTNQGWYSAAGTDSSARDDNTAGLAFAGVETFGGAGAGETWSGEMIIYNPGANEKSYSHANMAGDNSASAIVAAVAWGRRNTAEVNTNLRVSPGTGTFVTGAFTLLRRKLS